MSTASCKETSTGEAPRRAGSDLLLRKLPLLAKVQALEQQHPKDPQAECNLLCYGPEVYRIHSIACRRDDRGVLQSRRGGRLGEEDEGDGNDEKKNFLSKMDAAVALPTHMSFLAMMELELRKSMESLQDARRGKQGLEGGIANAKGAAESTGDKKKKKHGANWDAHRKQNGESDEGETDDDERVKDILGTTRTGVEVGVGGEECVLLRAIRAPRVVAHARGTTIPTGEAGLSNFRNGNRNSDARDGAGDGCMPWEQMLESIMSHYDATDDDKGGKAVQSYLRRVSWIERQKKLQSGLGVAAETLHQNEQPWGSMTDAMRVQKEMQRMRLQRKRFRRLHKG
ncbi:hypothetical protein TraAM80_04224 [Trypanosoma rangeli]|uniref:Uncharacterized protein n=1 Tax=Trypanosoma rangeli TaxID=5698 RepID=A0A3R7MNY7_TRYRA|nr:uncharacterized protein TraAM80_04224 [Trypanosoma rangeli]RNF05925.1 hypothetical protein TraAM80_04224 [Trypanosoma rangeli]|eukprot:RNF05925.1 hypothetical protein TraAM80_04224 [Trypanosoma rangeli]